MRVSPRFIQINSIVVWLIFMALMFWRWPTDSFGQVLAASTIILVTHISYAGDFLLSQIGLVDRFTFWLSWYLAALIVLLPFSLSNYLLLSANFLILFLAAIMIHSHILAQNLKPTINRLCTYKIRLELGIIAFILIQAAVLKLLPAHQLAIELFGLAFLVLADVVIIWRHRIYHEPL